MLSDMKVGVETLDNGLQAAFVNMPHFRTTSARLVIHSGSFHEDQETAGAAHFLEHVTFQGTQALPTEQDVHDFAETNGLKHNAFTSQPNIRYVVDGYDPHSVGHFITQLAFFPALNPDTLEKERNPIVDELRGYASAPKYYANLAHALAIWGDLYARPVGGTIEDVLKTTPESLSAYHQRNYRLGNAVLVMCSGESVDTQREIVEKLLESKSDAGPTQPIKVALPDFNPGRQSSSLQIVELPPEAQTTVGINYGVPSVDNLHDRYSYNILGGALAKAAHRRLRGELGICYGVQGGTTRLSNMHFGAEDNWSQLGLSTSLGGEDSVSALNAMDTDVFQRPIPESVFDAICHGLRRHLDHVLEGNPSDTANFIADLVSWNRQHELDLEDSLTLTQSMTVNTLRTLQKDITDQMPLVTATSPSPSVLEKIGEWANK